MDNPFYTLGYGGAEFFCDREQETSSLISALTNGRNVALISPRRLGKTGLILHAFDRLMSEDNTRRCFYLDIYSTENQTELVKQMASAILGSMDTFGEKVMDKLSSFFKSCRPVFSMDPMTGTPSVSLDIQPQSSSVTLKEIMKYMMESGHECFVAIDEFQQILEYPEDGTEALLRSVAQFAPNVHFIYAGSKQHLMANMFSSPKRPFYQSTQKMGLTPLSKDVYFEFAARLMQRGGKVLSEEVFFDAYDFAHGYTYYIQDIMNRMYAMPHAVLTIENLKTVYGAIRSEGEVVYKDYCDLMARGQLKLLRAIARENIVKKPHEQAFMQRHKLTAVSSVKLALNALVKNGIVAKSTEGYYIYDRYLSLWLSSTL